MSYLSALSLLVVGIGAVVTLGFIAVHKLRHWRDSNT